MFITIIYIAFFGSAEFSRFPQKLAPYHHLFQILAQFSIAHWWYLYYVQVLGVLLGIFNRFTAFTFPIRHENVSLRPFVTCENSEYFQNNCNNFCA